MVIVMSKESECPQVSYTVTLEDSGGRIEDQILIMCRNGTVCMTSVTPLTMDQIYLVRIRATNDFGEYSASTYLSAPIGQWLIWLNYLLSNKKVKSKVYLGCVYNLPKCNINICVWF